MRDRNAPLTADDLDRLDWDKGGGLIPAAVQDADTLQLLMLGYMSRAALAATLASKRVTFHSRSRGALWEKGETSGNRLELVAVHADCDADALLVRARPAGPTCHLGSPSCFEERGPTGIGWLGRLATIVEERSAAGEAGSYTARLLQEGALKIAQKVGEEGVELALAGAAQDRQRCIEECADLLYHLTVLMKARQFDWHDVGDCLRGRHSS